jgi:sugar phosphate isomerase/epimerase
MGLYNLVKDYDPRYVGAILDPAHNGLQGEDPEPALDIVASHLCVVNLKNAIWLRVDPPGSRPAAAWEVRWTSGPEGRASWPRVAAKIKAMDYRGPVCLSAEYSQSAEVDHLIAADLAYARACFNS